MNWRWSFWGLLALVVFEPGCGSDMQSLCEKQEACLGGNDADLAACLAVYDGARDNAQDIGCGDEYDAYIACLMPQYECLAVGACSTDDDCNGSKCIDSECKSFALDPTQADVCESEANAYSRCD